MLVVMVAIGGVPVPVVVVVDMVVVGDRLVPAAGSVPVGMPGMGEVRQRMLVVMSVMRSVRMALVNVVNVSLALGAGMAAVRPVLVAMGSVDFMLGCHDSSSL
jgi:hypothetical protein